MIRLRKSWDQCICWLTMLDTHGLLNLKILLLKRSKYTVFFPEVNYVFVGHLFIYYWFNRE